MSIKGFRHYLITEAANVALAERAEKNDVPVEVLQEVFDRGVLAWDESTQKTPDQYAFNRVDSFLAGGFAAKLDSDLLEVDSSTLHNYIRKANHVVDHTPENSKAHKKSKTGISRAERLLAKKTPVKEEVLEEGKIRHPTEKKAYVEITKTGGVNKYKASNKHGKVKYYNEHGRKSAFAHAGMDHENVKDINEVSAALAHRYVDKAEKSVHKLEDGKYSNHNDTKAFKRKLYIGFAKNKKFRKEENNVVDNSGEELKEGTPIEFTKLVAMHRRDTRQQKVIRRWNERRHAMRDFHRTENSLHQHFKKRHDKDDKFIDRHRHQKTDRWNTQKRQRVAAIRDRSKHHTDKQVRVTEGSEYIEARKKLHDAHHESARLHAGMERDPELRRMDLHRAKRHKHASRVLEILQSKKGKDKGKDTK